MMHKRRAYSQREQDYALELRNKLEEAEKMLLKIGPCRERSLAWRSMRSEAEVYER